MMSAMVVPPGARSIASTIVSLDDARTGCGIEAWEEGRFGGADWAIVSLLRVADGFTALRALGCFACGERGSFATFDDRGAASVGLRFALALVSLGFWMFMGLLRDERNISVALTRPADRSAGGQRSIRGVWN
jgi:hypothetical protein